MEDQGEVILVQEERTAPTSCPELIVWGWPLAFVSLVIASLAAIAAFAAAVGEIWSARSARQSIRAERRIAELNAISGFNNQYSSVAFDLRKVLEERIESGIRARSEEIIEQDELDKIKRDASNDFFRRYWALQYNQFRSWVDGFIPTETYQFWLGWQKRLYDSNEPNIFHDVTYRDGLLRGKDRIGGLPETNEFFEFLESVFTLGVSSAVRVYELTNLQRQQRR